MLAGEIQVVAGERVDLQVFFGVWGVGLREGLAYLRYLLERFEEVRMETASYCRTWKHIYGIDFAAILTGRRTCTPLRL